MKQRIIALILTSTLSVMSGCQSHNITPTTNDSTVEITFNYDFNADAQDLMDLLYALALQGHCQILINGTYVYLPPVGEWPNEYETNTNNIYLVNFPIADDVTKDCSQELNKIQSWIDHNNIDGVSIALGTDVDFEAVLSLLDLLNDQDVHYVFEKETSKNPNSIALIERNKIH